MIRFGRAVMPASAYFVRLKPNSEEYAVKIVLMIYHSWTIQIPKSFIAMPNPHHPLIHTPYHQPMTDCYYCNKDLEAGPNDGSRHDICEAEWLRRKTNGICTRCGAKPGATDNSHWVGDCDVSVPYKDYPGP